MRTLPTIEHGTPEWHAARRGKITSSIAAGILAPGQPGSYGNPLSIWLMLTGRQEPDSADTPERRWGRMSQPLHAELLQEVSGARITRLEPGFAVHPELDWLGDSADALGFDGDLSCAFELEAPTQWADRDYESGFTPIGKQIQLAVHRWVWDAETGILSGLVAPGPNWQRVPASPEMDQWVRTGLQEFYERYVVTDTPPPLEGPWSSTVEPSVVKRIWTPREDTVAEFGPEDAGALHGMELVELKAQIKELEGRKDAAERGLLLAMADAGTAIMPDGSRYTRKRIQVQYKAKEAYTGERDELRWKAAKA